MTAPTRHQTRRPWGLALACWCGWVSAFQTALAVGVPWGAASWGGGHGGVLPGRLRLASGGGAAVVMGSVAAVASGRLLDGRGRRRVLLGTAAYVSVGSVANALSSSRVEQAVWTPLSVVGAGLAWKAWREAG